MATGDGVPGVAGGVDAEAVGAGRATDDLAVIEPAVGVEPASAALGTSLRGDTATATSTPATRSDARSRRLDADRRGRSGAPK